MYEEMGRAGLPEPVFVQTPAPVRVTFLADPISAYVSLLRHVDCRVFIARNRLETLEHRQKRNRGSEAADPFIEGVLGIEHKIIAGHRVLADYVLTRDFDVARAG